MFGKRKKKLSRPRKIFNVLAAIGLAGTFGVQSVSSYTGDQTDDVLTRLNVDREQFEKIVGTDFNILYPEQTAAQFFAWSTLSPHNVSLFRHYHDNADNVDVTDSREYDTGENDGAPYYVYQSHGQAYKIPFLGDNEFMDHATFGLAGALLPSTVIFPSSEIEFEQLIEDFNPLPGYSAQRYLAGDKEDYLLILLLHEIAHTRQNMITQPDTTEREAEADKIALEQYLALGGKPEVVEEWIHFRSIDSLNNLLARKNGEHAPIDHNHFMAPILYAHFFGGDTMTPEQAETAYNDTADYLIAYAQAKDISGTYLDNADSLERIIQRIALDDRFQQTAPMQDDVRAVLGLYSKSVAFLTSPRQAPEFNIPRHGMYMVAMGPSQRAP